MSPDGSRVNGTSPDQIEAEAARRREAVAATVTDIQGRPDVMARARATASGLRGRATTPDGRPSTAVVAAAVAVVVLAGLVLRRRSH